MKNASPALAPLFAGAWEATRGERKRFFIFCFLFIASYSMELLAPWVIGYTLGVFIQLGVSAEAFRQGLIGILVYTLLRLANSIFHHLARFVQSRVAYSARMHTMSKLFDTLLAFPLEWHVRHHSGENLSKLQRSVGAVDALVGTYIWQMIEGVVKIVIAGIAIIALDRLVALNVLLLSSLTVGTMILFNSKLIPRLRANNAWNNRLTRICLDYLGNILTVKTLGVEKPAGQCLVREQPAGLALSRDIARLMEFKWGATGVGYAVVISSSLILYFYQHQSFTNAIEVAQVYVLLNYLDRIYQAIGSFTGYYSGLMDAATAYEDAQSLYLQAAEKAARTAAIPDRPWEEIRIKHLEFSYSSERRSGLHKLEFDFKRGERIALVGESGSGKSTLLKILAGLLQPEAAVLELKHCTPPSVISTFSPGDFSELASRCLLVPQEPEIFSDTVRYNLTMGEEFSEASIADAVSRCALEALIAKLPGGMETDLAEKGLNISVGERQRIALARGLLRAQTKRLVLLDEPTSSVDPITERQIFESVLNAYQDATIIASCHRLNLLGLFSKVVVLSRGTVVEAGSFADLLAQNGYLWRMWEDYQRNMRHGLE